MKFVLARRAERDIVAITDFIAKDNRPRAVSFVAELLEYCRSLTLFPLKGHARSDIMENLRAVHFKQYLILGLA
jgi:toxin ParE1/3/4